MKNSMKKWMVLLLFFLLTGITYAGNGANRGYTSRGCGFDLDDDGVIGEASDCRICDGNSSDPDGDGVNEDINYVNSVSGVDNTTCGASSAPCATIGYVLAGSNSSFANVMNGPGDGAEDIICIAGTHVGSTFTLSQDGIAGNQTNRNGFQYPTNPMMIVGWDRDGDGLYPPFDTDDTAVLDGNNLVIDTFVSGGRDYIEIAHLAVRNYDTGVPATCGGADGCGQFYQSASNTSHLYFHDLELTDIHRGEPGGSGAIIFEMFTSNMDWFAIENVSSLNQGGYFWRGGCIGCENWRFSELTVTWIGENTRGLGAFKPWDTITGITIENSIFRSQVSLWASGGSPGIAGAAISQCCQNVTIRNNEFTDFSRAIILQAGATGACSSRPVTNIAIDGNDFRMTYAPITFDEAIHIEGELVSDNTYVGTVDITNNFISNSVSQHRGILSSNRRLTSPITETLTIAGNTFAGDYTGGGVFSGDAVLTLNLGSATNPYQNYVIKNNIIAPSNSSDGNIWLGATPTSLVMDGNIYNGAEDYRLGGTVYANLGAWKAASGVDAVSTECTPSFVNISIGDLHLQQNDICAIGAGVDITSISGVDIDGDPRSALSADSGADEVQAGSQAPSPPQNLRLIP